MPTAEVGVTRVPFGRLPDGVPVDLFTLVNERGLELRAITYGGIIVSLKTPDRAGSLADIVLGFDTLAPYASNPAYFGAIIGRCANRIAAGRFSLDGKTYQLAANEGANHLHGGVRGFDKVVWLAQSFEHAGGAGVRFTHTSPDADEGYPGTLVAHVTYTLTVRDELIVDYAAATDRATVVNFTQHTYFNLAGEGAGDVLDHTLTIEADRFTPIGVDLIPTGELAPVAGTPFDFRTPTPLGARIEQDDPQLRVGQGYDHNLVLNRSGPGLLRAARLSAAVSGRAVDVYTTEPGLQLYSGNRLDGSRTGKAGRLYGRRCGVALETQHFPDSPNHPTFPSTILRPGHEYRSRTVFVFGVV
jgi:aldose 1-epimerase